MSKTLQLLIDKLEAEQRLSKVEFAALISGVTPELSAYLFAKSRRVREREYGNKVFIRGLIEFTNYCKNDCYYCGIRKSNLKVERYRLTKAEILECCAIGYDLGFRTFVLQGGEDAHFNYERMLEIITAIKSGYPDCALTLSIGEKSFETYQAFYVAGADRYLLRHETACDTHYGQLHPAALSGAVRKQALRDLKRVGFQTGTGFMVGSPYQTPELLAEDMLFIHELQPAMVGIGPFIPHHDTPFADEKAGTAELTLFMLGLLRLMLPKVLLPATTALGTIENDGRERGILAGANVVMPNLSPLDVRKKYLLYDNKIATGTEAAEGLDSLRQLMASIGYEIVTDRGDFAQGATPPGPLTDAAHP